MISQRARWIFALVPCLGLAVAMLIGAGSAAGDGATKVKSTVTIKSGGGLEFTGKVNSAQKKCRRGRKVELFMEPYSSTKAKVVGTAKTNASGVWTIEGNFTAGIYHAEVTAYTAHAGSDDFRCLGDLSVSAKF